MLWTRNNLRDKRRKLQLRLGKFLRTAKRCQES
jgi:hypothetical protein